MKANRGVNAARNASSIHLLLIFSIVLFLFPVSLKASGKKSGWIEVRSPNFTVDSNSGKRARKVARRFELIREIMSRILPSTQSAESPPLTILAVKNELSLEQLLPTYFKKKGEAHPAGVFAETSMGDFIVLRTDLMHPGVFNPVFHEYVHFVMRRLLPDMPPWLSEGLADLYSDTEVEQHDVLMGIADKENLEELHSHVLIPIRKLLAIDQSSRYYNHQNDVQLFYAESWALAHYLLFLDSSHGTHHLEDYVRTVGGGGDPVESFTKIFGPPDSFDLKLHDYASQFAFPTFKIGITERVSAKDYSTRSLSKAEADAIQANFLAVRYNSRDAEVRVKKALQEDPQLALPNAVMGLLMWQKGNRGKALEWTNKAIKLDPTDYHGYFYAALAMQGSHLDAAHSAMLEQDLQQTVKLRPGLGRAYAMLSDFYLNRKEKLDQALVFALEAARSEPENNSYLTNLEVILLKQGRQADAARIEMQMLARARTPKETALVRNDIGWALLKQNVAPSRADHEIRTAAKLEPKNADILDSLGHLLDKENQLQPARDAYQRALSVKPKMFSSLAGLGDVLRSQHDLSGAVAEYHKALAVLPNSARVHYNLSLALRAEGDTAQAASELKQAQKLDPFNPQYQQAGVGKGGKP